MPLGLLHEVIEDRRESLGLTKLALAERANVSPKAITNIERPDCNPTWETLNAVVDALEWSWVDLVAHLHEASRRPVSPKSLTLLIRLAGIQVEGGLAADAAKLREALDRLEESLALAQGSRDGLREALAIEALREGK